MQHRDRAHKVSLWLLASFALASFATRAQAQVVPDTTLGNGNHSVTSTTGNRTDITGGAGRGSALFHSFERFNISPNEQVYFANPTSIRNIFSRVTGGSLSNIDGLLGVAGSANLFFMNPNGIIFGSNARLDVSGSFLATTANALEFPDNQKFAATGDRAVPLVEVNLPIGLQFGANPPAMLTNRGNLFAGQDLTLAAGNLDLQGQLQAGGNLTLNATDIVKIRDTVTEPFLARSGGNLTIQGNQGIDILTLNHPTIISFVSGGYTGLVSNGDIFSDAHYRSGGNFTIQDQWGSPANFTSRIDPVFIVAGNYAVGTYNGPSLKVEATGDITAVNIDVNAPAPAATIPAGDPDFATLTNGRALILRAGGGITVDGGISTSNNNSTTADPVILRAIGPININGTLDNASIFGGSIEINTPDAVNIAGNLFVRRDVLQRAGDVTIGNLDQPSSITIGGAVSSRNLLDTLPVGFIRNPIAANNPDGGDITIRTQGALAINGAFDTLTGFSTPVNPTANPANVVSLASAARNGRSGDISITAGGSVTLAAGISGVSNFAGKGGNITIEGSAVDTSRGVITSRNDGSFIINPAIPNSNVSFVPSPGTAGNVSLRATTGDVRSGSIVASYLNSVDSDFARISLTATTGSVLLDQVGLSASNLGTRYAGDIFIDAANEISITNGSSIESNGDFGRIFLNNAQPVNNAQQVTIDKSSLTAINGSSLTNGSVGGQISINAPGNATTPGTVTITQSALRTPSSNSANGGRIDLNVGNQGMISLGSSLIDSSMSGTGNPGGGVTLTAPNGTVALNTNSLVTTATTGTTTAISGSPIQVTANIVTLNGSSALSATTANTAPGGTISVTAATSLTVNDSSLISTNVQGGATGNGGNIAIDTNTLNLRQGGRVEARTFGSGRAGDIQLNVANNTTISGFDAASQLYSGISTDTRSTNIDGVGGNITFNTPGNLVGNLTLVEGGFLSARTSGAANGGNIAIYINNLNMSEDPASGLAGGGQLLTTSSSFGNAGSITVNAAGNVTVSGSRVTPTAPVSPFTNSDSTPANFLLNLDTLPTFNNAADDNVEASGPGDIPFISLQRNPAGATTSIYATQNATGLVDPNDLSNRDLGNSNDFDYYSFSIQSDGSRAIFDIDNAASSVPNTFIDTELFLFDALTGQLLARNDDFSPIDDNVGRVGGTGSSSIRDSFLSYNFNLAGRYVLGVGRYSSSPTPPVAATPPLSGTRLVAADLSATPPVTGDPYRLQVSLQNRVLPTDPIPNFNLADRNPNQGLNSGLFAQSQSSGRGGNIRILQAGSVTLSNQAEINASTSGSGVGGTVEVRAGSVILSNQAEINASTSGSGAGGTVEVRAGSVTLNSRARINTSTTSTTALGVGGNIDVQTGRFDLTSNASLNATTVGQASSGNISVTSGLGTPLPVEQTSILVDGGRIQTSILPPVDQNFFGSTTAVSGNVELTAQSGSILLTNSNPLSQLEDSALVSASTAGVGTGGRVTVQTTGGGTISIFNGARVESRTNGVGDFSNGGGNAGNVIVNAPDITISGSTSLNNQPIFSGLLASSDTAKSGQGGSITVNATAPGNSLVIQGGGFLSVLNRSDKPGRGIEVNVNQLQLLNGGQIVTASEGRGTAGEIKINSPDVTISGTSGLTLPSNDASGGFSLAFQDTIDFSTLVPHRTDTGNAGQVDYYQFDSLTAGNRAIFDIDNSASFNDTELFLFRYDPTTNQSFFLARNDDSSAEGAARGSTSGRDSYLDYRFDRPGTYILAVAPYSFGTAITPSNPNAPVTGQPVVTPTFLGGTQQYTLRTSIDRRNTINPNQVPNSGLFAQSTAPGSGAGNIRINGQGAGQVTLKDGGQIIGSTISGAGGEIEVNGLNTLLVTNSLVSAATTGDGGSAGSITVNATDSVTISGTGGLSTRARDGDGTSGEVAVTTSQLTVQGGASITAETDEGDGNNITLSGVDTLQVSNGSRISASTESTGAAGSILLNDTANPATTIELDNGSIAVRADEEGGTAGSVTLNARSLDLQNNSEISAANISAPRSDVNGNITLSGLNSLTVNNSLISSSTQSGTAGSVTVNATEQVLLDGTFTGSNGTVPGGVTAIARDGGDAGSISIVTSTLGIANGAAVAVSSTNAAGTAGSNRAGTAGSVDITARTVTLNNAAQISAETNAGGAGSAANIRLQGLQTLTVNSSLISSATNSGTAGNVTVTATGQVLLNGTSNALRDSLGNPLLDSQGTPRILGGIVAEARQGGTAGDVTITSGQFTVQNGARASVSSPTGQAGNLRVTTNDLRLNRGTLEAVAGAGNGANIILEVAPGGLLLLRNGSLISANANNQANGGNITIKAPYVIGQTFENSDIVANAVRGKGGKIDITTNAIIGLRFRPKQTPLSDITASSDFGVNGSVNINSLSTDVTRGVTTPPVVFTDVSQLNKSACEAVGAKATVNSELRIAGQGGVTLSPTAPLPAQQTFSDWVSLDVSPQVQTNVTFSNGATVTLKPGQTYQVQATCVKSWQEQQRSLL
ncbi:MAG: filamentous hemagglutinin N-terminal domain-containing protein [Stenomitos frigidus ULC029]